MNKEEIMNVIKLGGKQFKGEWLKYGIYELVKK